MRWLVVVGLVACGRVGFDQRTDGGGGDGTGGGGGDSQRPVANRAFVTSTAQVPGNLGGPSGPDVVCADRAREAGLPGTFIAYVSTTAQGAADRLRGARGWTRTDGKPVFDTVEDLLANRMIYPVRLDENGTDLRADITYLVTTGTYGGGLNQNCADFSDPAALGMAGWQHFTAQTFANVNTTVCDTPTRLYCFQTDLDTPVAVEPVAGKKAFVSTGTFTPSSGVAAADAICATDATSAGLTGTFLALLPTAVPAADRFDSTGASWVRVDGVPLAASAAEFLNGHSDAPLNLQANGSQTLEEYVHTGMRNFAFAAPDPVDTCNTWSDSGGGDVYAYASSTDSTSLFITTAGCIVAHPVYCLEQ